MSEITLGEGPDRANEKGKRGLVISGGTVEAAFAASYFTHFDWDGIIAADAGLRACEKAGIMPDLIVGDFDSLIPGVENPDESGSTDVRASAGGGTSRSSDAGNRSDDTGSFISDAGRRLLEKYEKAGVPVRRFHPEKDFTDTQIAVEAAISLGCTQIHVLGGTGTRLDHILGNLQVMEMALDLGVSMILVDACNRVSMHREPFVITKGEQWGRYISFIPWGGDARGLTLRGFKYPLEGAVLSHAQSLGISNELSDETGEVFLRGGTLIMAESADG